MTNTIRKQEEDEITHFTVLMVVKLSKKKKRHEYIKKTLTPYVYNSCVAWLEKIYFGMNGNFNLSC